MYELIDSVLLNPGGRVGKIDSLLELSAGLLPAERYALLLRAVPCLSRGEVDHILWLLDSLPFPEVRDKATGLMLLESYGNFNSLVLSYASRIIKIDRITSLMFDMENRWRLTPQERLSYMRTKGLIYYNIFEEYKSVVAIVNDGLRLAHEYNADQETIAFFYNLLLRGGWALEKDECLAILGDDFEKIAVTHQMDSSVRKGVYDIIGILYMRLEDYDKAYDWCCRGKKLYSRVYFRQLVYLYMKNHRILDALAYIERHRKYYVDRCVAKVEDSLGLQKILFDLSWLESCIRLEMADSVGYRRCLQDAAELFDSAYASSNKLSGEGCCAFLEAYARMLWQQGKHSEAIRRLESEMGRLRNGVVLFYESGVLIEDIMLTNIIGPVRLLRDYYRHVGCMDDFFRQSLLCDSLEQQLAESRFRKERRKWQSVMYTKDLQRNLEFRAQEIQMDRQRLYFAYLILGIVLLVLVVLWVFYRQRQCQLNLLYARQKEMEQLQMEKQRLVTVKNEKKSPEEQLFRELESLFYEGELFRNPGFSRDDLCRLGGSNRMYVSTSVNKYAGTNINKWINKARVDYAIRLIVAGEDDLNKLSEQSGFSSLKSFFRSFKQFTELTPHQYIVRERQREKPDTYEGGVSEINV